MTEVRLKTLDLDSVVIVRAINLAKIIADMNGCKEAAGRPIVLVTDDFDEVLRFSPTARPDRTATAWGISFITNDRVVIWLNPILNLARDKHELVRTFIHEVAHGVTHIKAVHGWTWRRMFAILLAVLGPLFNERYGVHGEISHTIQRYQRTHVTDRYTKYDYVNANDRRWEEEDKHQAAVDRMIKRLRKKGIIG